jgi:hypothetical protein
MGINVRHDVDPAIAGTVAIMAGQGEYKRWLAQHTQRERMQAAQIAAAQAQQQASLQAQREAQEAARYDRSQQLEQGYQREDMEYDRRRQDALADMEAKRTYEGGLLQDQRAYNEKMQGEKILGANAGWESVQPFDLEGESAPPQMPDMFKSAIDGTGAEWLTPGYGKDPEGGIERQWDLSKPKPDPDKYKLDAWERRKIEELNNQISQVQHANVLPQYKAPALKRLQDQMNKLLATVESVETPPERPKIVLDEQGREWLQDGKGFKPVKPEPEPKPEKPTWTPQQKLNLANDIKRNHDSLYPDNPMPFNDAYQQAEEQIKTATPRVRISTAAEWAALAPGTPFTDNKGRNGTKR